MFYSIVRRLNLVSLRVGKVHGGNDLFVRNNLVVFTGIPELLAIRSSHAAEKLSSHAKIHLAKRRGKTLRPHHCITYFGSVHAFQTNSRGASKTLVTTIRSVSLTVFFAVFELHVFHLIHKHIQLVETLFPESAIISRPVADFLDRLWPKRAHTLSSTLRLDHNPRPHQVGNMF